MTSTDAVSQVDPGSFSWDSPSGVSAGVRRVVAAATSSDGRSPLDEAALLSLRHSGLAASTLWVAELSGGAGAIATSAPDNSVIGFALADAPPGTAGDVEVNLVVAPSSRREGAGRALAATALAVLPDARVSAWSHGNHPAAAALASSLGFDRVRDLWIMRRSLRDNLPEVPAVRDIERIVVRTFEPGRDEEAFLALNAAAFADHPEQGNMTRTDLDQRMAEEWFDPSGFFLAESTPTRSSDPARLLGFHWTKIPAADGPYGEVYVVGVSPDAQGMGLGKVLTLTGLHHLQSRGLDEVILHVESDNAAAVKVYAGLGFTHADEDTDVMYRRPRATSRT